MGVMGNQELQPKPASRVLNVSQDKHRASVNSPTNKTFRVSFGKTMSVAGNQEKPRFEIVPNDAICIVEVPRKKHIEQQRTFDIISNESKLVNPTEPEKTPTSKLTPNQEAPALNLVTSPRQKNQ